MNFSSTLEILPDRNGVVKPQTDNTDNDLEELIKAGRVVRTAVTAVNDTPTPQPPAHRRGESLTGGRVTSCLTSMIFFAPLNLPVVTPLRRCATQRVNLSGH